MVRKYERARRSVIEQVKDATDFPALVEETTGPLRRRPSGQPVMVHCPLHADDRTPSLAVYGDHAHCFGCGWHGDCFDWVGQRDGVDFRTALQELAHRAGVPLPSLTPQEQKELQRRREYQGALGVAARHFARRLQESPPALDYARGRAWSNDAIAAELLGCADGSPLPNLENERAQRVAGALNRWAGKVGGALIYAHQDRGRVVYLAARSLESKHHFNPPADLAGPKRPYLNVPYSASAQAVVIVEGQGDALTLCGWEIPAIALAGSGLTGDVAARLQHHVEQGATIYVVPDADGKTRVEELVEPAGPLLHLVTLPDSVPDTNAYAQDGADAEDFRRLLDNAPTWLDLRIKDAAQAQGTTRDRAIENLFPLLAQLPPITLARYKRCVTEALEEIGARDFDRLLKDARASIAAECCNGCGADPARYVIEGGQHCLVRHGRNGERRAEPLSNFTAQVIEDVGRDDGAEVQRQFTIVGQLQDGRPLPTIQVDAAKFTVLNWVNDTWGVQPVIRAGWRTRDQLREAIQLHSTGARSSHVYTHTGWREIGGRRVYLHARGALGMEGVAVELSRELARYSLPALPHDVTGVTEAMQASLRFLDLAPDTVTVPLWAAVFLAPLTEIVSLDSIPWLYGTTGALKSTIAALALCHYGAFTWRDLPATWASTPNSLEMTCFQAKDVLLVIDDFAPQSDPHQARKMEGNASRIVRSVGNRSGRGRLRSDLSQHPVHSPRGLVISTGEQVPGGQSIAARMYTIEIRPGDVDLEQLTAAQEESSRYPYALAGYLLWVADQWDHLVQYLPQKRTQQRAQLLAEMDDDHLRIPDALTTLYLGLDLGLAYAVEVQALTEAEATAWRERGWTALKAGAEAQARSVEQERPTVCFLEVLGSLLAQGRVRLEAQDGRGVTIGGGAVGSELLGWYDTEFVYLLPGASYNRVARFLRDEGARFPVKETTLRKHLAEEGYLLRHHKQEGGREVNRSTDTVRIGDDTPRTLWLYRAKVENFFAFPPVKSGNNGNNGNSDDNDDDDIPFDGSTR